MFMLCDRENDMSVHPTYTADAVRSVWIPQGKSVKLYNRINLLGKSVLFTAT
jgi:hypothetical protein